MCPLPDKDSGSTYGALNKVDYQNLPPADPTTDWSNPLIAPAFCNVAALTQTAIRADITMTLATSTGGLVLENWHAVWDGITTTDPVITRLSTGVFRVTWPTHVSDEYNGSFGHLNNHTVNFTKGWAQLQNPGGLYSASVVVSANTWTIYLYDNTNALNDFPTVHLDVFGV